MTDVSTDSCNTNSKTNSIIRMHETISSGLLVALIKQWQTDNRHRAHLQEHTQTLTQVVYMMMHAFIVCQDPECAKNRKSLSRARRQNPEHKSCFKWNEK